MSKTLSNRPSKRVKPLTDLHSYWTYEYRIKASVGWQNTWLRSSVRRDTLEELRSFIDTYKEQDYKVRVVKVTENVYDIR